MDTDYLKSSVGDALTQGLAAVAVKQPNDPVEFLGNFLVAYVDTKQKEMEVLVELTVLSHGRVNQIMFW
jgi:hypothetical protein